MILAIYFGVALGLAILVAEPFHGYKPSLSEILMGIAVGLCWPIIMIMAILSTLFLYFMIWYKGL